MDKLNAKIINFVIVLCWVSLAYFWVLKLFFGDMFLASSQNENFIYISELIESGWLKYLVSLVTVAISNYLIICAILQVWYIKGRLQGSIIWLLIISIWAVSSFVPIEFGAMPFWYGYAVLIGIGIACNKRHKKRYGVFAVVLHFIFSTISIIIRTTSLKILTDFLTLLILMIDVYIMIILYYFYSNLIRRNEKMFIMGLGWLSDEKAIEYGISKWSQFWNNLWHIVSFRWLWGKK